MRTIFVLIRGYQWQYHTASGQLATIQRSAYALEAFARHGVLKEDGYEARILSCHPSAGVYDGSLTG